ncbi:hypothetical protein J4433_02660 [Candidatus Pacearchaeota archaeon]|nr:hypothetical protein [Candidatus Pacearchaeota archaeon]
MNPGQEIKLGICKVNFMYLVMDKTYPLKCPAKWCSDLKETVEYIQTKYQGIKIVQVENTSDNLSTIDRKILKESLFS